MNDPIYPFTKWRWSYINPQTKRRRQTHYLLAEEEARAAFGEEAEKIPGTKMVITGPSSDFGAWMPNTRPPTSN